MQGFLTSDMAKLIDIGWCCFKVFEESSAEYIALIIFAVDSFRYIALQFLGLCMFPSPLQSIKSLVLCHWLILQSLSSQNCLMNEVSSVCLFSR